MKIHTLTKDESAVLQAAENEVTEADTIYGEARRRLAECRREAVLKHADKTNRVRSSHSDGRQPYEFSDDYSHLIEHDAGTFYND